MASRPTIASPPTNNPKLGDYLKTAGQTAKPPTSGRSQPGGLPRNKPK